MKTPAIQHSTFPDGGFVLHKITFVSENGRFSAWFAKDGTVLDSEQITTRGNGIMAQTVSRPVKKDGPIWRMIRTVGHSYVKAA